MPLTVAETRDHFMADGLPFFYLADTIWSTFVNAPEEGWRDYLRYRRQQGFNVLQISVLPILHDRSESTDAHEPFLVRDGRYDFDSPREPYLERADRLLEVARLEGFIPALVLLWCNYIPGTWAAARAGQAMTPAQADAHVERVVRRLAHHDPIWIVSGDTDWPGEAIPYYERALQIVKSIAPRSLTTFHTHPDSADVPERLAQRPELDFLMYQSGHHLERLDRPYTLAEQLCRKSPRRPVVNGELCYEGHGYADRYGRWTARDVRRALWQSLLSGAKAGVAYGAHGVWGWHRRGERFSSEAFSSKPYPWSIALSFPGAWDAGFARWIVERYGLHQLQDNAIALSDAPTEVRAAATTDHALVVVYAPAPVELHVQADLSRHRCTWIDLSRRRWLAAIVSSGAEGSHVEMPEVTGDSVFLAEARPARPT